MSHRGKLASTDVKETCTDEIVPAGVGKKSAPSPSAKHVKSRGGYHKGDGTVTGVRSLRSVALYCGVQ